jgi:AcrR family transcriptional regulator
VPTQAERRALTAQVLRRSARRLFAHKGFERVSVDDLAADAGVTRGALYHHFESKERLFEVVFEEVARELAEGARRAAAPYEGALEQLRAGSRAFIDLAAQDPDSRIALVEAPTVLGPTRCRELEEAHFLALVRSSVHRLRPAAGDPENALLSRALGAALCELGAQAARAPGDLPVVQAATDALVAGLGA